MDPLSGTASIIAILQLTTSVVTACNEYRKSVKNAHKDAEQIVSELNSLKVVLEQLLRVADKGKDKGNDEFSLAKLTKPNGELASCRTSLTELHTKLQPYDGWKGIKTALTWHFKEGEFKKTLERIAKSRDALNLAVTADTALVALGVQDDVVALSASFNQFTIDEKQQKAIHWLNAPDPSVMQAFAGDKREATTGWWFLESPVLEAWKSKKPNSLLWLQGIPGSGKTVLCSSIIYALGKQRKSTEALAYFYFDFVESKEATVAKMLRSLATQLAVQNAKALASVEDEYKQHGRGTRQPSPSVLSDLLAELFPMFENVYLIIDALDECTDRDELLEWIEKVAALPVHLLLSSRKEKDIDDVLSPLADPQISMQEAEVDADIKIYIRERLSRDKRLKKWPAETKKEIEQTIASKARGMFRWAVCQLDMLGKCNNIVSLRKALETVPKSLDDTYNRILLQVDEVHTDDVRKVLQWLCFSTRPMLLTEMVDALAVDGEKFDPDLRYADSQDILGICSSLVSKSSRNIKRNPWAPKVERIEELRLAHYSVKEYLISERLQGSSFYMNEAIASAHIAQTCVAYLLQFQDYRFLNNNNIAEYPLAAYAAKYWTKFAGKAETSVDLAQKLLSNREICRNWISLWDPDSRVSVQSDLEYVDLDEVIQENQLRTPLYYACLAGLPRLSQSFLQGSRQVSFNDQKRLEGIDDIIGATGSVLQAAAHAGNPAVVEMLIEHGANVNNTGGEMGSALEAAAAEGHEGTVLLLLAKGADPGSRGGFHGSPLQAACYKGNLQIASALLKHGANVNQKGGMSGSAMTAAASRGHDAIMELLMANGADINAHDLYEETALYQACERGSLRTVKWLIAKGADVRAQGFYGGTALFAAAKGGNSDIVRLLLEHGADASAMDTLFGTPLAQASHAGSVDSIRLLLKHGADVNQQSGDYGSALAEAASAGREEILDILLANGASVQGAPLQAAMQRGRLEIAKKLIEHGADVDAYAGEEGFALHAAASAGKLDMVKFLVENGADVNIQGGLYGTALAAAASSSRVPVVEYLLTHGAKVNTKCGSFGSALQSAAENGDFRIVELLLRHGADPKLRAGRSCTALHAAAEDGSVKILNVLLRAGADIEARSTRAGTPLNRAVTCGQSAAARTLLQNGAALSLADFHDAAYSGLTDVIEMMLEDGGIINAQHGRYGNALQAASAGGHTETIQLLLDKGAEVNAKGGYHDSALQAAAQSDNLAAVELLVSRGADVQHQGGEYCTALQAAAYSGEHKTIQFLLDCCSGAEVRQYANVQGGCYGSALQAAAQSESRSSVVTLLSAGANANAQGGEYGNALQAAAQQYEGDETVLRKLIDAGADVNARGGQYGYALQAAASSSNVGMARMLLNSGADVNAKGGEYGYAILAAAEAGHLETMEELLAHGALANVNGPEGDLLYHAAAGGNAKAIQIALDHGVLPRTSRGQNGTALQAAISSGSINAVKLILSHEVDVNARCGWSGSALIKAIEQSEEEMVRVLLAAGADINAQIIIEYPWYEFASDEPDVSAAGNSREEQEGELTGEGEREEQQNGQEAEGESEEKGADHNALHAALCQENEAIRQLILAKTTDINARGCRYGNALQAAIVKGHLALVKQVLDLGADVHLKGGKFGSAVQAAAWTGEISKLKLLFDRGADVNHEGGKYGFAIQAAAAKGHADAMKLLLESGAEVNAKGGKFGTALKGASYHGHTPVVQLLLSRGASIDDHDAETGDALQAASAMGQVEVVELLLQNGAKGENASEVYGNALQAAIDGSFSKVAGKLIRSRKCLREGKFSEDALKSARDAGNNSLADAMSALMF